MSSINNMMNNMSNDEVKKTSWAPDMVPDPENIERQEWEAKRQAALDNATITIASALVELVNEQKRINDYIISGNAATATSAPAPKKTTPVSTTAPNAPADSSEDSIIAFYKQNIETVLGADDVSKTTIRVQESDVYIKFPWLGKEKFGPVGGLMRELGAQYVSAGKDTHYLAPRP